MTRLEHASLLDPANERALSRASGAAAVVGGLGDARWRQLLADHDRMVRRQIERYRVREIDTTGDGFFVAFDSAAAAVHCARAIRDEVRRLDLHVRIGVHTGEIETAADGVRGTAIHALARIMSAAGPSEILVSPITRALT
jgi:class 3 adenylate cyclase